MRLFRNQRQAAEELAHDLRFLKDQQPVVLGLVPGGVLLAEVVASELNAPLDVMLVKTLAAPNAPEHTVGAVDEHGRISMIKSTARWHHLTSQQMVEPARAAFADLQQHQAPIREIIPSIDVRNRTVILVAQAINTGAKMLGAVASVRNRGARTVVAAAPAGLSQSTWQLHEMADHVVIPHQPTTYNGIESIYENHIPANDQLVLDVIKGWVKSQPAKSMGVTTRVMKVPNARGHMLTCHLDIPPGMKRGAKKYPAVIFAHGFESDAQSPRSVPISRRLAKRGIIGVRMDFTGHGRSEGGLQDATEVQMLHDLHSVFQAVEQIHEVDPGRIGLNGAGSGALIALHYAAKQQTVRAMVIRGPVCGREVEAASKVHAPTLLIHAEHDTALRESIEAIDQALGARHELMRIAESNRLFSDPVSLELMVSASVDWLADHLTSGSTPRDTAEVHVPHRDDVPASRSPGE
jgi:putative phosphoribosyl transferase